MRVYDEIIIADEHYLDTSFRERFKDQLVLGSRGYGYWAWKPQIVLQVLKACNSGDIVHYVDIGCHMNPAGRERLQEYFEAAGQSAAGVLAFSFDPPKPPHPYVGHKHFDLPNGHWTKGDLLDHLAVRTRAEIVDSQTIGATTFFIKKSAPSNAFLQEWLSVIEHDFRLIDDTPSVSPNPPGFIEHRHDQAIFSLLCRIHKIPCLSGYEYDYPLRSSSSTDWGSLTQYPIHARRDKDIGLPNRVLRRLERMSAAILTRLKKSA